MKLNTIFTRTKLSTRIVQCLIFSLFFSFCHSAVCSAIDLSVPVEQVPLSGRQTGYYACSSVNDIFQYGDNVAVPDGCNYYSSFSTFMVPGSHYLTALSPGVATYGVNDLKAGDFLVYELSFLTTVSRDGNSDLYSCVDFDTFNYRLPALNTTPLSIEVLGFVTDTYSCRSNLRITFTTTLDRTVNRFFWLRISDLKRVTASSISVSLTSFGLYRPQDDVDSELLQTAQDSLAQQEKQTELQQQQTDFVTSTETPDADSIATADSLPSVGLLPAGPVDSILLLPANIMNSILSSLGGSCTPVVAPLPFVNTNITFPCFGDTIYKGSFAPLVNIVGGVASALLLYSYFKHLYKKVDRAISLETTDEDEWGVL